MLSKLSRLIQSLKSIQTDLVHAISDLEQCEGWVSVGDLIDQGVMTKNKAQGQSLQWMLNDVRKDAFSSGQEFVADSRPVDIDHAALFADEDQVECGRVLFTNVVYPELLE